MAAHDGNTVSPPARFAFEQAVRIAPSHPAPPFFLGLAHIRADDYAAARPLWARAVALSPAGASYRRDIALRLALLDRLLARQGPRRR
jgi:cytochrome c-type biogenesis protein CcmH/NrfG